MGKHDFMDNLEEKLRNRAEVSADKMKEELRKNIEKDRQKVAKDLYNIFTNTGNGSPNGEMGHIFKHKGDSGGMFFGEDEE